MLRRMYYFAVLVLLILGMLALMAFPAMLSGCTKSLTLKEYDPTTGKLVREGTYRNTGFETRLDDLELETGDTQLRIRRYDAQTESFEVAGKALDLVKEATAGKVGAP